MCPLIVILNRLLFAPAALPALIATIGISDFPVPPLPSSLFKLVGKCAFKKKTKRRYWDLLGYYLFSISGSNRPYDPGWIPLTRHDVSGIVACWRLETIGPFQRGHFGTLHLHGRLYPLPLLLACFRAYASSNLLPAYLQGSIPGLWLAVTEAGFPPARICSIAQPQLRPDPNGAYLSDKQMN